MKKKLTVFISTGEISGDIIAENMMAKIVSLAMAFETEIEFCGMAGDKIVNAFDGCLFSNNTVQSAGLIELVPKLKSIRKAYKKLLVELDQHRPDLAILIDFPDFNMKLAKEISNRGIPLLYYVAPQCWAWRKNRVEVLKNTADKLAVIFPFEKKWFLEHGLDCLLCQHPVVERIKYCETKMQPGVIRLGLFPGSRVHEISKILPVQLEAVEKLSKISDDRIEPIVVAAEGRKKLIEEILRVKHSEVDVSEQYLEMDLAWCAAGTVTLELAMRGVPWILTHKVNRISYMIAKNFIKTEYLGMPNILLERKIAPELVQKDCNPDKIVRQTIRLLTDSERMATIKEHWKKVREMLGESQADIKIEQLIMEMATNGL